MQSYHQLIIFLKDGITQIAGNQIKSSMCDGLLIVGLLGPTTVFNKTNELYIIVVLVLKL